MGGLVVAQLGFKFGWGSRSAKPTDQSWYLVGISLLYIYFYLFIYLFFFGGLVLVFYLFFLSVFVILCYP